MLAACGDSAPTAPAKPKLAPEQIIQYKESKFACTTKDLFSKASEHAYKKEETKFRAMFTSFDCFILPTGEDFKVLSIVERHTDFDVIEITNAKNLDTAKGLFAGWDY